MSAPHRKRPSDIPYRATRWADVGARFDWDAFSSAVFTAGMACLLGAIGYVIVKSYTDRSAAESCAIVCHPHGSNVSGGNCYCLPDGAPAYQPGEAVR